MRKEDKENARERRETLVDEDLSGLHALQGHLNRANGSGGDSVPVVKLEAKRRQQVARIPEQNAVKSGAFR